jgi:hypothetical protein
MNSYYIIGEASSSFSSSSSSSSSSPGFVSSTHLSDILSSYFQKLGYDKDKDRGLPAELDAKLLRNNCFFFNYLLILKK